MGNLAGAIGTLARIDDDLLQFPKREVTQIAECRDAFGLRMFRRLNHRADFTGKSRSRAGVTEYGERVRAIERGIPRRRWSAQADARNPRKEAVSAKEFKGTPSAGIPRKRTSE